MAKSTKPRKPGRPTKYREKFCQEIVDFYDVEPWDEREIPHYRAGEVTWTDIKILPARRPTLRRFAKHIGVHVATLYDWVNPENGAYQAEFHDAFTRTCKPLIKDFLIDAALAGITPPATFKFVAVNMTDMRDKMDPEGDGVTSLADALAALVRAKDDGKGQGHKAGG